MPRFLLVRCDDSHHVGVVGGRVCAVEERTHSTGSRSDQHTAQTYEHSLQQCPASESNDFGKAHIPVKI